MCQVPSYRRYHCILRTPPSIAKLFFLSSPPDATVVGRKHRIMPASHGLEPRDLSKVCPSPASALPAGANATANVGAREDQVRQTTSNTYIHAASNTPNLDKNCHEQGTRTELGSLYLLQCCCYAVTGAATTGHRWKIVCHRSSQHGSPGPGCAARNRQQNSSHADWMLSGYASH